MKIWKTLLELKNLLQLALEEHATTLKEDPESYNSFIHAINKLQLMLKY